MRGLTVLERQALIACAEPPDLGLGLDDPDSDDREWDLIKSVLTRRELVRIDELIDPNRDWAIATDLGLLALRACPVEDT